MAISGFSDCGEVFQAPTEQGIPGDAESGYSSPTVLETATRAKARGNRRPRRNRSHRPEPPPVCGVSDDIPADACSKDGTFPIGKARPIWPAHVRLDLPNRAPFAFGGARGFGRLVPLA